MCGIWGATDGSRENAGLGLKAMAHRGPDASGIWVSPDAKVILGHVRLSIIDLSPTGSQPMVIDDGKLAIVFNGEIYNFQRIRQDLEALGDTFLGKSDTEVVLKAYRRWGHHCLDRFNGMFALAIYDARDRDRGACLFLARDRVGKKPLYYSSDRGQISFASELKGFAGTPLELDRTAVALYLGLGYIPGSYSFAKGMNKLPPASWALCNLRTGAIEVNTYWKLPEAPSVDAKVNEGELLEELESLFLDAVKLRMISDVPLGVFLSGGVDSSLVVAAAAKVSAIPVKTYTITFPGHGSFDESGHAKQVAQFFGTDHHFLEGPALTSETLKEWASFVDEPLADSSVLPTFWVSRLARKHVTVALGGDGGDELFAGYNHYSLIARQCQRMKPVPQAFMALLSRASAVLPSGIRGRNTLMGLREGPENMQLWNMAYFDRPFLQAFGKNLPLEISSEDYLRAQMPERGDLVSRMTRLDFLTYLPDDILAKVDRAGMACSLECRSPWLDYRMVEFAFGKVPTSLKICGGRTRYLQRKLAEKWLPKTFDNSRKQGFSPPMDKLLVQSGWSTLQPLLAPTLSFLRPEKVMALWGAQRHGRKNGNRLFALAMLGAGMKNLGISGS